MSGLSLQGKRVLELGGMVASPYATSILAHLGAEVIKIESPQGDPTRRMVRDGPGGSFIAFARGKQGVCIDLRTPSGYSVFLRLLRSADILVLNLSPKSSHRLKVTYEECMQVNPDLIYCHVRGYGPGPMEDRMASNPTVEAATGVMYSNQVNGRPTRLGPSYHDMFAGSYAAIGILAAIISRGSAKTSASVEVGLYETGLHIAARELAGLQLSADLPPGTHTPEFVKPGYAAYKTSDSRWIFLIMLSDLNWKKFCDALPLPAANDATLATMLQRHARMAYVDQIVQEAIGKLTFGEIAERLDAVGFGYSEVVAPSDVLGSAQARYPGKTVRFAFHGKQFEMPNFPIWGKMIKNQLDSPPPELGQHTFSMLRELGYSDEECEELIASKAVIITY